MPKNTSSSRGMILQLFGNPFFHGEIACLLFCSSYYYWCICREYVIRTFIEMKINHRYFNLTSSTSILPTLYIFFQYNIRIYSIVGKSAEYGPKDLKMVTSYRDFTESYSKNYIL